MPSHGMGEDTGIRGSLETPVPVTALLALLKGTRCCLDCT